MDSGSADVLGLVGTTIADKYVVETVVGEGGFAIVYRATHTVWNRPVAIKVFRALADLAPERRAHLMEGFLQEGRLLAELSERSAAICQARDVGMLTTNGRELPYMVLEWLDGRSLEQVLEREQAAGLAPRSAAEALAILEPAAEALALAHRKGIAHRDVKPANIFVLGDARGDFTVKLLDFGIAKVVQDAQRLGGSFAQTQGVVTSFTPAYGAPEQFSRAQGATGPWTDVFAIALIFSELMTYAPPLPGDDLTQLAFASMDPTRRPTPRAFGVAIPDALEGVLLRALAVSPDDRFRSMGEFWDALRRSLSMAPPRGIGSTDLPASSARMRDASAVGDASRVGPDPLLPKAPVSSATAVPATALTPFQPAPPATPSAVLAPSAAPAGQRSRAGLLAAGAAVLVVAVGGAVGVRYLAPDEAAGAGADARVVTAVDASASAVPVIAPEPQCPSGMTRIDGGKFFMGSDDKNDEEHERPAHQVALSPYCVDTTEVTVAAYKACSDRGECKRAPKENEWPGINARARKIYDPLCNIREPEERASHPINCIDWELADAFCSAVGKRLPTEAEWEFATRGSDGRKYPWGDDAPTSGDHLNACGKECVAWGKKNLDPDNPLSAMYTVDDGFPTTAPAGSFPKGASPFGLQDVVGNVWEWVSDWYAPYGPDAVNDPKGPETGTQRVLRGGAWNGSDPAWVRPTYRFESDPGLRSHGIGFRCAKSL